MHLRLKRCICSQFAHFFTHHISLQTDCVAHWACYLRVANSPSPAVASPIDVPAARPSRPPWDLVLRRVRLRRPPPGPLALQHVRSPEPDLAAAGHLPETGGRQDAARGEQLKVVPRRRGEVVARARPAVCAPHGRRSDPGLYRELCRHVG